MRRQAVLVCSAVSALLIALLFGVISGSASAAPAAGGLGDNGPPPRAATATGSTSGSDGGPVQKAVQNCAMYANASNFGVACLTGGGTGKVQSVRDVLGTDALPTCWDDPISAQDLAKKYLQVNIPAAPYYLHSCVTGIIETNSMYNQPKLQLNPLVIELRVGAPDCPKPYDESMVGTCRMTLTAKQRSLVSGFELSEAQIPPITIVPVPSAKVRTNEAVAFVDVATDANGKPVTTRTPDYRAGGVTMWAQMTGYGIFPNGPSPRTDTCRPVSGGASSGPPSQTNRCYLACDGTALVPAGATPDSAPHACWWRYPKSSANQPGKVYPLRAEADWSVYYRDAGGTHTLQRFHKFDDLTLPVSDIQTVVIK